MGACILSGHFTKKNPFLSIWMMSIQTTSARFWDEFCIKSLRHCFFKNPSVMFLLIEKSPWNWKALLKQHHTFLAILHGQGLSGFCSQRHTVTKKRNRKCYSVGEVLHLSIGPDQATPSFLFFYHFCRPLSQTGASYSLDNLNKSHINYICFFNIWKVRREWWNYVSEGSF